MGLTDNDIDVIEDKIELGVRRYFDHYLETILPATFAAHDESDEAHGGIVRRFERFKWVIIGASFGGGVGGGVGLAKLLNFLS